MIRIGDTGPENGGLGAAVETKLVEYRLDVGFCGVGGDGKGAGYLFIALALGEELYNLKLARSEAVKRGAAHRGLETAGPVVAGLSGG